MSLALGARSSIIPFLVPHANGEVVAIILKGNPPDPLLAVRHVDLVLMLERLPLFILFGHSSTVGVQAGNGLVELHDEPR